MLCRDMVMITLRTDLSRIQRTNLETCITVHMHQKESTEDLVRKKVSARIRPCSSKPARLGRHYEGCGVLKFSGSRFLKSICSLVADQRTVLMCAMLLAADP